MSTYVQTCEIVFPKRGNRQEVVLNKVNRIQIKSGWKLLTDTATVVIPRRVIQKVFDPDRVKEIFRRGDPIAIYFGYDGNNVLEFTGYITQVSASIPLVLKCQDEMWKLKKKLVSYSSPNTSLKNLLKQIAGEYPLDVNDGEKLGAVRFSELAVSSILEKLREEKNIYSYFKGKTLVVGKVYADDSPQATHKFHLERNAVSNNLQYKRADDQPVLIIARALINGKKIEVKVGQTGGDVYKLSYSGSELINANDLRIKAESDLEKKQADGFDGSITAFGIPRVFHGEKVELYSRLYSDRNGVFYTESVDKSFSGQGIRQVIKLAQRVRL